MITTLRRAMTFLCTPMTAWRCVSSILLLFVENAKTFLRNKLLFQHLLDWSRGMVSQIGQLGDKYAEWVNKPVDRPLRLFDSNALEMLTKTPWWLVPSIWIPVICCILHLGIQEAFSKNYSNVRYKHSITINRNKHTIEIITIDKYNSRLM